MRPKRRSKLSAVHTTAAPTTKQNAFGRARGPLVTGLLGVGAAGYLYLLDPSSSGAYVTCPWLALTGLFCPGCGGLRSTHAMLHWEWAQAASFNLLWTVAAPLLAGLWVWWLVQQLRGRDWRIRFPAWAWTAVGILIAIFWVLRNTPALGPWLAPA